MWYLITKVEKFKTDYFNEKEIPNE